MRACFFASFRVSIKRSPLSNQSLSLSLYMCVLLVCDLLRTLYCILFFSNRPLNDHFLLLMLLRFGGSVGWVGCVKMYSNRPLMFPTPARPPTTYHTPIILLLPFYFTILFSFSSCFDSQTPILPITSHILLPQPFQHHPLHVYWPSNALSLYIQQPLFLYNHSPSSYL